MKRRGLDSIEKRARRYVGYVPEVHGANSEDRTIKVVYENLKEAVALVMETNSELGIPAKVFKKTVETEI